MPNTEIPFRPKLEGEFRRRFYAIASQINPTSSQESLFNLISSEISWVERECNYNISERKIYRACLYLWRDLVKASWASSFKDGVLLLKNPEVSDRGAIDISAAKLLMRQWMSDSRLERIHLSSQFITSMEEDTNSTKSIRNLIADGQELYDRLISVCQGNGKCSEVVKPYLQLVEENARDQFTNQKLGDIWRYFRQTWSTPHETTPGRTMQYLVRDAAHPMHAVMGILSLENCAVQITDRDNFIGWNATDYARRISLYSEEQILNELSRLSGYIIDGISGIKITGLCTKNDIDNPSEAIINKLICIAKEAEETRQSSIQNSAEDEERSDLGQISKATEEALYRRKRADSLSRLLKAKLVFKRLTEEPITKEKWEVFCNSEIGLSAIRTALVSQKTKHIGSSMMELNVCGAIPPYNHILGGKLVALLACSPQILHDYKDRYSQKPSEIASRLKGKDVCRPADLVYIGTTSLYDVGSSQYNRLVIPGDLFGSDYSIKWANIGKTMGYGTWHITRATTFCLNEVSNSDVKKINHVFGEGASPKLRMITESFPRILEDNADSREFARHSMRRIVFGAMLASNTREYLLGTDTKAQYPFSVRSYAKETEKIINFWQERWLGSRIHYLPALEQVRSFNPSDILVSNDIKKDCNVQIKPLEENIVLEENIINSSGIEYVKLFYHGSSSFADMMNSEYISTIHVPTKLDVSILEDLKNTRDVVLTGNPGDGKTHLIRIIQKSINNLPVTIELDASTKTNSDIYESWKSSKENGIPYLIAVNAAVLLSLYQDYPDFKPIESAYEQMIHAISFGQDSTINDSSVVVYDLSKRDILTKDVLVSAISNLTKDSFYNQCSNCAFIKECDVHRNRTTLNNEMFQNRLAYILGRVSLLGYHATLRELQALISYLLFADRNCNEIAKTSGKYEYNVVSLLYKGKGPLFDKIRESFDPARVSHPVWDEKILDNTIDSSSWISDCYVGAQDAVSPENVSLFSFKKRQFYFFNKNGDEIAKLLNDDITRFQEFLSNASDKSLKREIIEGINAFFSITGETDLFVWSGHRYGIQPRKVLISTRAMKSKDFVIIKPELSPSMARGIECPNFYLRFALKENKSVYLKIDFPMFKLFEEAKRGAPVLFLEQELSSKVWRFMEKLQSCDIEEDEITISIMDLQNKKTVSVSIEEDDGEYKYMSIKSTKN